jgi:cerevisin
MKSFVTLSLAACAAAAPKFSTGTIHDGVAPILSASNVEEIPNSYIIKFKSHVNEAGASDHHTWIQQLHSDREDERLELRKRSQITMGDDIFHGLKHTYKIGEGFLGYSGHFDDHVIEQVRRHPDVS